MKEWGCYRGVQVKSYGDNENIGTTKSIDHNLIVAPSKLDPFKFKEKSLRGQTEKDNTERSDEDPEVNDLFNKIVNANDGSDSSLQELRKTLDLSNFITLKSSFKHHDKILLKLNAMNKNWTANLFEGFKDKSIGQLNNMAGNRTQMRGSAKARASD